MTSPVRQARVRSSSSAGVGYAGPERLQAQARPPRPGPRDLAAEPAMKRKVGRPEAVPRLKLRKRRHRAPMYYIFHGGHQESTGTADKAEAQARFAAYLARIAVGGTDVDASLTTIGAMMDEQLACVTADADAATMATKARLDRVLRPFWGTRLLRDIHPDACDAYWATRKRGRRLKGGGSDDLVSAGTIRRELGRLQTIVIAFCVRHGVGLFPVLKMPPPTPPRVRWLWRYEVARLLCAARGRIWDQERGDWRRDDDGRLVLADAATRAAGRPIARLVLLGAFTGTRADAMRRVRWYENDYDPFVKLADSNLHRRGWRERVTKKRRPVARLCPELLNLVARWAASDAASRIDILIHDAGQELSKQQLKERFRTVRIRSGLGPDVTIHTLRHTCATWLLEGGAPPEDVGEFIGLSVGELERSYGQVDTEFTRAAADGLNEWGRARRPGRASEGALRRVVMIFFWLWLSAMAQESR